MALRIAFVTQPFSRLELPLRSDSLGIWTYQVARRCAEAGEVTIYTRNLDGRRGSVEPHDGLEIRRVRVGPDLRMLRSTRRARAWAARLGRRADPRKPFFASPLYYPGYAAQIARDLRQRHVDVVHLHNFSQFVPMLRAWNPRVRIVLHMECEWLSQLDPAMMRRRAARTDRVLGCSDFITERIRACLPEYAERCHTLYNGVDIDRFVPPEPRPAADGPGQEGPRLLFIGRVSPEKGVHVLLEAFRRVLARHPKAQLEIVGPQQPAPPEYILDLSDDPLVGQMAPFFQGDYLGEIRHRMAGELQGHVQLTANLPPAELVPRYQEADVFLFPSVWHEPFGMPVIEALACGTPVVATRSGGIPELLQHDETGFLVPRGDVRALADAILAILDTPERARAMGKEGRRRVAERFAWERIAERLLEHAESR